MSAISRGSYYICVSETSDANYLTFKGRSKLSALLLTLVLQKLAKFWISMWGKVLIYPTLVVLLSCFCRVLDWTVLKYCIHAH